MRTSKKYERRETTDPLQGSGNNTAFKVWSQSMQQQKKLFEVKQVTERLEEFQKKFGFDIDSEFKKSVKLVNDFGKSLRTQPLRMNGPAVVLTSTGYLKNIWVILNVNELYMYQNRDQIQHNEMFVV